MSLLGNLNPGPVWTYFEEICTIPRLSKNEGRIRKYLLDFAGKNKLEAREDKAGNILIIRNATEGMENRKSIVLQSHMDMVGEKNVSTKHDWSSDPIRPVLRNGWVGAIGTTLGADDGIGIAAQMAILTDKELKCGRIECLFTVDEESGMTGAINLDPEFFTGTILLNLDSEDEGILYIGCAGGMDTLITMPYKTVATSADNTAFEISITGLHGGHSGDEIHKGYANSIKLMTRLLAQLHEHFSISLGSFEGGNLRNAIPRESFAVITFPSRFSANLKEFVNSYADTISHEFGATEPDVRIETRDASLPSEILDEESLLKLLRALESCPHGVISWSKDMEDLVETSSNLASVRFIENNNIRIVTTQRSSVESAKQEASAAVESCFRMAGADVLMTDGYPGWKPDISSEILGITRESYRRLFGMEPQVRAIHAGLECGLIYEKNKDIDMISFGPTIRGAHTPEEMIEIASVGKFWDLLTDVIRHIPPR
jgi:dipeptidase D